MLFSEALYKLQTDKEVVAIKLDDTIIEIGIGKNQYLHDRSFSSAVAVWRPDSEDIFSNEWELVYRDEDIYLPEENIIIKCANIKQLTTGIKDEELKKKICRETSAITKSLLKIKKENRDA